MAYSRYYVNASSSAAILMPKWLRNGIHLVEAEVGTKWVTIRRLGAARGRRVPKSRWDALLPVPYTGQTPGEAMRSAVGGNLLAACPLPAVVLPHPIPALRRNQVRRKP